MKNQLLVAIVLVAMAMMSCGDNRDAWMGQRGQMIGTWEGTATYTRTYDDGEVEEGERPVEIRLASEGVAILEGGFTSYEWFYQPEPETILLESINGFSYIGAPSVIDVIENGEDRQVWETSLRGSEMSDSVWLLYDSEEVWMLERK